MKTSARRPPLPHRHRLLLLVLDRKIGRTVVQITSLLKPFYPPARPTSQLSVRVALKHLHAAGWVIISTAGKPHTYIRAPASYRVLPASWKPLPRDQPPETTPHVSKR